MRSSWLKRTGMAAAFALALGTAACSGDEVGPGEWTLEDLQGTWVVTRFEYTADLPEDDIFDLIEDGDQVVNVVIDGNGNYTITQTVQGLPPVVTAGTFSIDNSGNVVDSNEGGVIDISRDGDVITLRDETVSFDFDGNAGTPETGADLLLEMELQ